MGKRNEERRGIFLLDLAGSLQGRMVSQVTAIVEEDRGEGLILNDQENPEMERPSAC